MTGSKKTALIFLSGAKTKRDGGIARLGRLSHEKKTPLEE
jgi:hypothetical protein